MIGFIGLSHLGLNYSVATAAKGFRVAAYDPDPVLVARCQAGDFPIEEPGFNELFSANRGRLAYTADASLLAQCDLVFYSLDIRTDEANRSDVGPLTRLIDETAQYLSASATVVVLSQVPPGYTRQLIEKLGQRTDVAARSFYYQVETLIFGSAVQRAMAPERFIVGSADPSRELPLRFSEWHAAFECPVLAMRFESAELAKIAINFFLVSSVTTTNVLAEVCESIGADWSEIVPALRLDKRIGQFAYLKPGMGIAGGNLERDLVTVLNLPGRTGADSGVIRAWQANSAHRRRWALTQLEREVFNNVADPVVAIWGLTYKPDTHSIKNSPSLELVRQLRGKAVRAHDPVAVVDPAEFGWIERSATPLDALNGADVLVIMAAWKLYADAVPADMAARLKGKLVLDPYGALDPAACRAAGLAYRSLGC